MPDQQPINGGAPSERRRSERFLLDVSLLVRGESAEQKPFEELTFSISISTHGALVVLAHKVTVGQKLFLKNPETQYETEGRVARLGAPYGGLAQVGIEFPHPAPELWTLASPLKH
jgi:PilZ domain-containing protein